MRAVLSEREIDAPAVREAPIARIFHRHPAAAANPLCLAGRTPSSRLDRRVSYAFAAFQSVQPARPAPRRPRDGQW